MTNLEVDAAVRLRAASVVFRALVIGATATLGQRVGERRITWEEWLKAAKALDAQAKANGKPPADGDTEH